MVQAKSVCPQINAIRKGSSTHRTYFSSLSKKARSLVKLSGCCKTQHIKHFRKLFKAKEKECLPSQSLSLLNLMQCSLFPSKPILFIMPTGSTSLQLKSWTYLPDQWKLFRRGIPSQMKKKKKNTPPPPQASDQQVPRLCDWKTLIQLSSHVRIPSDIGPLSTSSRPCCPQTPTSNAPKV